MILLRLVACLVAGVYSGHLFSMISTRMSLTGTLVAGVFGACLVGVLLAVLDVTTPLGWFIDSFVFAFAGAFGMLFLARLVARPRQDPA